MTDEYEHLMSAGPRGQRRLLFYRGTYDALPGEVRRQGPWTGERYGKVVNLKPEYRLALARDGYILLLDQDHTFRAEVQKPSDQE
jgi:hypothetical protein